MWDFNACLSHCMLNELNIHGGPFTWTNNQEGVHRGWSKLDWGFVNPSWLQFYPNSVAHVLSSGTSDHSSLVVSFGTQLAFPKSFKFLNCWIDNEHFSDVVAAAWLGDSRGTPMFKLFAKLKKVKHVLGQLHKSFYSSLSTRVMHCYDDLLSAQFGLLLSSLDHGLMEKVASLKEAFCKFKKAEMSMLAQRAKITHLKLSDSNTSYFYASVAARKNSSVIGSVVDFNGQVHCDPLGVANAFCYYYQYLLGTSAPVSSLD
ncbi:hypothetical protein RND81_05G072200 [Saponaria officinalis]|uniref:Uncharacterized protein n=1 Tax=Saponaria officinalis TaxID=3572 RepID=A0AAW1KRB1_SAPOF